MPVLQCYVDDRTFQILRQLSEDTGREIEELAEAAIEDSAIRAGTVYKTPPLPPPAAS